MTEPEWLIAAAICLQGQFNDLWDIPLGDIDIESLAIEIVAALGSRIS